ncbi:GH24179 [Drosophila grimshawi]|uniref:GH24179 n=1 Tax=Drosophila grimshawi TaxID=7222 RepID=B4JN93_DROGR|nr:GH24179 [Drosophila grimshawi]
MLIALIVCIFGNDTNDDNGGQLQMRNRIFFTCFPKLFDYRGLLLPPPNATQSTLDNIKSNLNANPFGQLLQAVELSRIIGWEEP